MSEPVSKAKYWSPSADLSNGPEAVVDPTDGIEVSEPLADLDFSFEAWEILAVARIEEAEISGQCVEDPDAIDHKARLRPQ